MLLNCLLDLIISDSTAKRMSVSCIGLDIIAANLTVELRTVDRKNYVCCRVI